MTRLILCFCIGIFSSISFTSCQEIKCFFTPSHSNSEDLNAQFPNIINMINEFNQILLNEEEGFGKIIQTKPSVESENSFLELSCKKKRSLFINQTEYINMICNEIKMIEIEVYIFRKSIKNEIKAKSVSNTHKKSIIKNKKHIKEKFDCLKNHLLNLEKNNKILNKEEIKYLQTWKTVIVKLKNKIDFMFSEVLKD